MYRRQPFKICMHAKVAEPRVLLELSTPANATTVVSGVPTAASVFQILPRNHWGLGALHLDALIKASKPLIKPS